MEQRVRLELRGKDEFWTRAFRVEWEDQFPDRKLESDSAGDLIAAREWLEDLERVAAQTFCRVVHAPANPDRRRWMNSLVPGRDRR